MSELDELLRDGLRRATDPVEECSAEDLARRLVLRRAATAPTTRWTQQRSRTLVAALVVLALGAGALGWAVVGRGDRTDVVVDVPAPTTSVTSTTMPTTTMPTTTAPIEPQPAPVPVSAPPDGALEQWPPGWYQLDAASLPPLEGPAVWFRGELHVTAPSTGPELAVTRVFRRDAIDGDWTELPPVQLMGAVVVAAGEQLVAVGELGSGAPPLLRGWAVLAEDGSSWRSMGTVRPEPTRASSSYIGPRLVWTGERVLDTTGAAVLDPRTGTAAPLEVPDEERLVLTFGTTLWTGDRAVLATWGPGSGVAWDATGRLLGQLPPADDGSLGEVPTGDQPVQAAVAVLDGAVVATAAPPWSPTAAARLLRAGSDRWVEAPPPPAAPFVGEVNLFTQCRSWLASARGTALSLACNAAGSRSAELHAGTWSAVGVPEVPAGSAIDAVDSTPLAATVRLSDGVLLVWVPAR